MSTQNTVVRLARTSLFLLIALALIGCQTAAPTPKSLGLTAGQATVAVNPGAQENVTLYADVPYVPNPAAKQVLDLYLPNTAKPAAGFPVIVYVHGGGFTVGDKGPRGDDIGAVLRGLGKGFAVASVNYRLSGTDKAPAQIYDVKAALRYVKANAAAFGLNPKQMVLLGVSAGGSLASLAAASANSPAFDAGLAALGAAKATDDVAAAVILYGLYNLNTLQAQFDWLADSGNHSFDAKYLPAYASQRAFFAGKSYTQKFDNPKAFEQQYLGASFAEKQDMIKFVNAETYISAKCPPMFVRHGEIDEAIPFLQSVDFTAALKAAGVKVDFATVPGAEHGLPGRNFFQKFNIDEAYSWLAGVLK